MANSYFQFKRFTVHQERCAMKVGTDGTLIGAWGGVDGARRILDIGTGTGLIALMAAQRNPEASVVGVEIDDEAAVQARDNVRMSPWSGRIEIVHADLKDYAPTEGFDAILSNPPYFDNDLKCPDIGRNTARHTDRLTFADLMRHVARLLTPGGEFSVIIPSVAVPDLIGLGIDNRLFPVRKTWVQTTPKVQPKRCMLAFRFTPAEVVEEETMVIQLAPMEYSEAYRRLTGEFYLK